VAATAAEGVGHYGGGAKPNGSSMEVTRWPLGQRRRGIGFSQMRKSGTVKKKRLCH